MKYRKNNTVLYGVAVNDSEYKVVRTKDRRLPCGRVVSEPYWICPFYVKWASMLSRCYGKNSRGSTVSESWLVFSNFKSWMEGKNWEGNHLDKDLLVYGNKVYSEETCIFIPNLINNFIKINSSGGVHFDKTRRKFRARVWLFNKKYLLGDFTTENDARLAYLQGKIMLIESLTTKLNRQDTKHYLHSYFEKAIQEENNK